MGKTVEITQWKMWSSLGSEAPTAFSMPLDAAPTFIKEVLAVVEGRERLFYSGVKSKPSRC